MRTSNTLHSSVLTPLTLGDEIASRMRRIASNSPRTSARTSQALVSMLLVAAGTGLTAAAAQVRIQLAFTPVPITGQTFAVLLVGSVLGAKRAALSQAFYIAFAAAGLPILTNHKGGWTAVTGSSMGYLVGFVVAATFVGYLSQRKHDREVASSVAAMAAGSLIIYTFGALWLAHSLQIPLSSAEGKNAIALGVAPFLVGDALKLVLAATISPLAWHAISRARK